MTLRLFKYRSCEAALRDLENGTLWFARPDTLNDTLETRFQAATTADFRRSIAAVVNEVAIERGEPPREWAAGEDPELEAIINRENARLAAFCAGLGIYAAARRPDHQAMWAYYADNGSGVCFELELTTEIGNAHQLWAADVAYEAGPRVHNRADDMAFVFRRVADENPNKSIDQLWEIMCGEPERGRFGIETAGRAASRKHTDWQHEDEIRLLVPIAQAVPILKQTLKAVHFLGPAAKRLGEVFLTLHNDYPGVGMVQWDYDDGEMHLAGREMELRAVPITNLEA